MALMNWRRAVGVTLLLLLSGTAIALLVAMFTRPRAADGWPHLREVIASAFETLRQEAELRDASDVVVDREPSGTLVVSGRALAAPQRLSSTAELKGLLQTLPTPGLGLVTISYTSNARGIQGLVAPTPTEARLAERELIAALEDAGFRDARRHAPPAMPAARAGRPTMR